MFSISPLFLSSVHYTRSFLLFLSYFSSSSLFLSSSFLLFVFLLLRLLGRVHRQRNQRAESERVRLRGRLERTERSREMRREISRARERERKHDREIERGPIVVDPDQTGEERTGGGRSSMGRRRTRLPTAWSATSGG
jgi:hypothetical protein